MLLEHPSSSLERLHYDPQDHDDILPYADAFEDIRRKIGQDFSLRKIGEGAWGNVFELYKDEKGLYVVKLPRPFYLHEDHSEIIKKIQSEITRQKEFIERYESLLKKYHKASLSSHHSQLLGVLSRQQDADLQDTSSLYSSRLGADSSQKEVFRKIKLLNMIKIPKLLEVYQGNCPIIIMDKIPGKSLWFEILSSTCSPLFNQKRAFGKTGGKLLERSERSLYDNCIAGDLNDKIIAQYVIQIEASFMHHYGRDKAQRSLLNPGMLEAYPDLTVSDFIVELDQELEPPADIFYQLYGNESQNLLQKAYDFFLNEFGIPHPDPNLYNFIITPDKKLGIIDFG